MKKSKKIKVNEVSKALIIIQHDAAGWYLLPSESNKVKQIQYVKKIYKKIYIHI